MIVYGGCFQNNVATAELLGYDLEYNDWSRFQHSKINEPLSQVQCTVVVLHKKQNAHTGLFDKNVPKSTEDDILEGIYYFGGKTQKGELQNQIRYLNCKINQSTQKVNQVEWMRINFTGNPPCGRVGHMMEYLPLSQAIIVVGGRNDDECKRNGSPFLDDMYLFLLEQKAWIKVKYIPKSQQMSQISNHSMCVQYDHDRQYQRIIVFAKIKNVCAR